MQRFTPKHSITYNIIGLYLSAKSSEFGGFLLFSLDYPKPTAGIPKPLNFT